MELLRLDGHSKTRSLDSREFTESRSFQTLGNFLIISPSETMILDVWGLTNYLITFQTFVVISFYFIFLMFNYVQMSDLLWKIEVSPRFEGTVAQ